jgi:hypothetical protein
MVTMKRFMVFNTAFNNISVISWRSVALVEKTDNLYRAIQLQFVLEVIDIEVRLITRFTYDV